MYYLKHVRKAKMWGTNINHQSMSHMDSSKMGQITQSFSSTGKWHGGRQEPSRIGGHQGFKRQLSAAAVWLSGKQVGAKEPKPKSLTLRIQDKKAKKYGAITGSDLPRVHWTEVYTSVCVYAH